MTREYRFYTYILGSISGTLYIGMTNNLVNGYGSTSSMKLPVSRKVRQIVCCTSRASMMFAAIIARSS